MRPLIVLIIAAGVAAGGCHLIYPFDVDTDPGVDLSARDGTADGPPALDARREAAVGLEQGVKLDQGMDLNPGPDLPGPDLVSPADASPVSGNVTTIAGSGQPKCSSGFSLNALSWDFTFPAGLAVAPGDVLWIVDRDCHRVLELHNEKTITAQAGSVAGFADDTAILAKFNGFTGVTAVGQILYIADTNNNRIRMIDAAGFVSTVAGSGAAGFKNDTGTKAMFNQPVALAYHANKLYVADRLNCRVRVVDLGTKMVGTVAGQPCSSVYKFLDGKVGTARFYMPSGVAVDSMSKLYVADRGNHRIRKIDGAFVVTVAGSGTPGLKDGPALSAQFNDPVQIAVDGAGQVYVADRLNYRIRLISGGQVTTVAGSTNGFQDGPLKTAKFLGPVDVALLNSKVIYVADGGARKVRKVVFK